MITKEDIEKVFNRPNAQWHLVETGVLFRELLQERDELKKENKFLMSQTKSTVSFMNQQAFLDSEIDKIKKERDEALRRGDAYREVAIQDRLFVGNSESRQEYEKYCDTEATKILEREIKVL